MSMGMVNVMVMVFNMHRRCMLLSLLVDARITATFVFLTTVSSFLINVFIFGICFYF